MRFPDKIPQPHSSRSTPLRFFKTLAQSALGGIALSSIAATDETPKALFAAPPDSVSWQGTFGTDQRLQLDSYLGIARGYIYPKGGLGIDFTDQKPKEIVPVTGRFSGERRWFDFEGKLTRETLGRKENNPPGRGGEFQYGPRGDGEVAVNEDVRKPGVSLLVPRTTRGPNVLKNLRAAIEAHVDQIWMLPQITHQTASLPYGILDKQGLYFKDQVYECAKLVNSGEFKHKPIEVYFEIGNEVNTPDRFSVRDHGPETFNPENASDYVEFYLAPAVEAIRAASRDIYGDESRIKIVSGSVTGILKARGPIFLRALLNHTIRGDHAPSLAGKKAHELIHAFAIHYPNGDPLILKVLYDEWVASGKVAGMWVTEEGGWRGAGDYAVATTSFRWLDFWARRPWAPDTARMLTWGTNLARYGTTTRGIEMEKLLGGFFQNYPITAIDDSNELALQTGADAEVYGLRADAPDHSRRYGILVIPRLASQYLLSWLRLKTIKSDVAVQVYRVPRDKTFEPVNIKSSAKADGLKLDFQNWDFRPDEMMLILISVPPEKAT